MILHVISTQRVSNQRTKHIKTHSLISPSLSPSPSLSQTLIFICRKQSRSGDSNFSKRAFYDGGVQLATKNQLIKRSPDADVSRLRGLFLLVSLSLDLSISYRRAGPNIIERPKIDEGKKERSLSLVDHPATGKRSRVSSPSPPPFLFISLPRSSSSLLSSSRPVVPAQASSLSGPDSGARLDHGLKLKLV